jgi:5-methylcytosine-specific restriction endonuclease McrA
MKTFICLACGKENRWSRSTYNKYCNNICQGKHKWETQTVPRIEEGKGVDPSTLKKYLVERRGETCEDCKVGNSWNGKHLTLHLDHKDGNSDNNFPDNLRLLCPNCHSQTDNHGSKGQGARYKKITKRNSYLREYKQNIS